MPDLHDISTGSIETSSCSSNGSESGAPSETRSENASETRSENGAVSEARSDNSTVSEQHSENGAGSEVRSENGTELVMEGEPAGSQPAPPSSASTGPQTRSERSGQWNASPPPPDYFQLLNLDNL